MNLVDALIWGGVATVTMTTILQSAMYLGWTRMSLPFLLGTIVTSDRRLAPVFGMGMHILNGYAFAFGYALAFESLGRAGWWIGALLSLPHTMVVLMLMPHLAGLHPRMATEQEGPGAIRALQPPGFLALNYGTRTPLFALLAHLAYGAIMGAFYTPG